MNTEPATAILIAGMHRSGTSAVTGALGAIGVMLGERLLAPGRDNPKGYWEHEGAVSIHERLLASLGRHWDDVRALPEGWQSSAAARTASIEIHELISRDFAQATLWAVKDPRMCRFLPLWLDALKHLGIRPVVLFAARRPSEVAASIEARNHWAPSIGELLWLRHVLEAEAASRSLQRYTVIYDDLLADPEIVISNALDRLGIRHVGEHDVLTRLVDVSDRHHRHTEAVEPSSDFGAIAQSAYEALVGTAHGDDAWNILQECGDRLSELWRAHGAPIDAVADMACQIRLKEAAAQLKILDLSSKLNAQIQWSEQAVAIRSELRSEYQLALDAIAVGRERLASELESASALVAQERAEHEATREAFATERERLTSELESASALAAQERAEHEATREAFATERERLASDLESVSALVAQERAEHEATRRAFATERGRLASELESASALVIQEQAEHEAIRKAFATEQNRLAEELNSAMARAIREQVLHEGNLRALSAERDILARELDALTLWIEQERPRHESQARELLARYDEQKQALSTARAEVSSLNAAIADLHRSLSWRITRPLRILGRLLWAKPIRKKSSEAAADPAAK